MMNINTYFDRKELYEGHSVTFDLSILMDQ